MVSVPIPLPVSNVLLFLFEFLIGLKLVPSLFNYFGYKDALRWTGQHQFTKRRFRFLSGGHEFGYYSVTFFTVTVSVGLGLVYSLDSAHTPIVLKDTATLLVRNKDYSRLSDSEITTAARLCRTVDPEVLEDYRTIQRFRMPMLYRSHNKLLSYRTENPNLDRMIGQWLVSCTGHRLGETISATGKDVVVPVEMLCCHVCTEHRRNMTLHGSFLMRSPGGHQAMREICSPRNDELHAAAFDKLREINGSVADIYTHLNDVLIPSMLWRYANKAEPHEYVYDEVDGTEIGFSFLCVLLFLAPLILFMLDSFRSGTWTYHGTSDQDVVQYWAAGRAFFRPQHDGVVYKWRIVCKLLGKREFEERVIGGGGWNVFDRTRLKWKSIPKHAEADHSVVTAQCPICANVNPELGYQESLIWNKVQ